MSKVIVITGASQGIGATLARHCAEKNYSLLLVARNEEKLKEVQAECNKIYESNEMKEVCRAVVCVGDVTKRADVNNFVSVAVKEFGRLDVLVNNAGVGISKRTLELTDDDFDNMMSINCKSALYGMQAAVTHFQSLAVPSGQVINVSSMLGRCPSANFRSAYCAAKHALNSLTATARMDMADGGYDSILICDFHPGVVGTDFGLNAVYSSNDNRLLPDVQDVEEVAGVILSQITKGQALIDSNLATLAKQGLTGDASLGAIGVVDGVGIFDVYSRPEYQERIVKYYAAADMREFERASRAHYKDMFLAAAAKRVRDAANASE